MSGMPHLPNLCFPNPRPAQSNPNKHAKRHTLTHKHSTLSVSVSFGEDVITDTKAENSCSLQGSGGPEKGLRAPSTVRRQFVPFSQHPLIFQSHLVVYDHHVVTVRTQPGVHGLADAADFIQGWSMVVRPAKVQHLRKEERECCSD